MFSRNFANDNNQENFSPGSPQSQSGQQDQNESSVHRQQPKVLFDVSKKEQYTPVKGYKQIVRRLKQHFTVDVNNQDITLDRLLDFDIVMFVAPQEEFSDIEFDIIRQYLDRGGSTFLLLGDGHGGRYTALNSFLGGFGITLNEDCVVRTVIHNYLHPKEVCITNGVTNRELNRAAAVRKMNQQQAMQANPLYSGAGAPSKPKEQHVDPMAHLTFVYPHGLTLNVQRPAVPLLSSGFMAYPLNRPIAAAWECPSADKHSQRRGKLLVFGSAQAFEDSWLVKEENDNLINVLLDYLLHQLKLNQIDADNPEITDYNYIPDTASLADRLRVAVEEQAEIPRDFTQMFDQQMFKFDTDLVQEVVHSYDQLGVKHEPLTLIHPEFSAPLPPRLPATFDPIHRDPPPPALDLFDLDEHFATERVRLSQLTNKCNESNDVEFFIREASEIMGITKKLRSPRNKDPRALLDYVFRQVVQYKKQNADSSPSATNRVGSGALGGPNSNVNNLGGAASNGNKVKTRILRMSALNDPSLPQEATTPFEPPWSLMLSVDEQTGRITGELEITQSSPHVEAQTASIEGESRMQPGSEDGHQRQLVWHVAVRSPSHQGEAVPMQFNAMEMPLNSESCQLQGEVQGFGGQWQFNYQCGITHQS